ncbi:MAG: 5-oxoprolinase subunit PxpA [Luteimonas sp.]
MPTLDRQKPRQIDFNCDLGEGCGSDAAIVPWISSASIACGGHAGDASTMREAVALCQSHGVAIGAHPSYEDREHFGRHASVLSYDTIHALVMRQVNMLATICHEAGAKLHHVKPHGALYNLAASDAGVADAIARAVRDVDPALLLYGLSESELTRAGESLGLRVAHEAFAERRYEADGSLTPRTMQDAVIDDLASAVVQTLGLLRDGHVLARTGERIPLRADTLCLHGDRADAPTFARGLRDALDNEGIAIVAPSQPRIDRVPGVDA